MLGEVIIQALWLILPAYVANASALLLGGGTPIDFGRKWKDGKRVLGDGKTWKGLFAGAFVGVTAGSGLSAVAKYLSITDFNFMQFEMLDFEGFPLMIPIIFSLCFGALCGDMAESFFKRRVGKERGENWFVFDQLDFIVGALVFCFFMSVFLQYIGLLNYNWFVVTLFPLRVLALIIITPFLHLFANIIHRKNSEKTVRANKI